MVKRLAARAFFVGDSSAKTAAAETRAVTVIDEKEESEREGCEVMCLRYPTRRTPGDQARKPIGTKLGPRTPSAIELAKPKAEQVAIMAKVRQIVGAIQLL